MIYEVLTNYSIYLRSNRIHSHDELLFDVAATMAFPEDTHHSLALRLMKACRIPSAVEGAEGLAQGRHPLIHHLLHGQG